MVFFNYALRKLNAKIVYYGPGLCGKTTNLQWVHDHFDGGSRGKMISLATEGDRTIFFDLLPLDIGTIRGMEVTLQLYTVPGQVHYNSTRQLVLRGADGVVFVADSQRTMKKSNVESLRNLQENLLLQGIELSEFPHVLQFNKRDLRDLLSVEELDEDLNVQSCPFFEAQAVDGIGVQETLEGIVKLVMRKLRDRYERAGGVGARPGVAPGASGPAPAPTLQPPGPAQPIEPPAPAVAAPEEPATVPPPMGQEPVAPPTPLPGTSTEPVIPGYQNAGVVPEGAVASADIEPEPDVVAFSEPMEQDFDQDNVTTATHDGSLYGDEELVMDEPGPPAGQEDVLGVEMPVVESSDISLPEDGGNLSGFSGDRSVEDLLEQATGASTVRVEDPSDLHGLDLEPDPKEADTFTGPAVLDEPAFGGVPSDEPPPFGDSAPDSAFAGAVRPPVEPVAPPASEDARVPLSEAPTDTDILFPPEAGEELLEVVPDVASEPPADAGADPFATSPDGSLGDQFEDHIRAPSPFAEVPLAEPKPTPVFEAPERPQAVESIRVDELEASPFESPAVAAGGEPPDEIVEVDPFADQAVEPPQVESDPDEILYEAPITEVEPVAAADGGLVFGGDDDPFADPFGEVQKEAEPPAVAVEVMPSAPETVQRDMPPVDVQAEGNRLALRLQGTGAIAEAGQVRELDIEVPVPGAWVGNQRVTLQLRLTLVPSQEEEDDSGPGGAS